MSKIPLFHKKYLIPGRGLQKGKYFILVCLWQILTKTLEWSCWVKMYTEAGINFYITVPTKVSALWDSTNTFSSWSPLQAVGENQFTIVSLKRGYEFTLYGWNDSHQFVCLYSVGIYNLTIFEHCTSKQGWTKCITHSVFSGKKRKKKRWSWFSFLRGPWSLTVSDQKVSENKVTLISG